jgi:calcium-dependent protein kinase
VILYILLCGYPPFNGANDKQIIQAVMQGQFTVDEPEWADVSDEAKDLVSKLLTYNPAERISAMDALQHPWLKKMVNVEKVKTEVAKRTLSNLRNFRVSKTRLFIMLYAHGTRCCLIIIMAVKRVFS